MRKFRVKETGDILQIGDKVVAYVDTFFGPFMGDKFTLTEEIANKYLNEGVIEEVLEESKSESKDIISMLAEVLRCDKRTAELALNALIAIRGDIANHKEGNESKS